MVSEDQLREFLASRRLKRTEAALALLCLTPEQPSAVKTLLKRGLNAGVPEIRNWNLSQALKNAKGLAVKTTDGWVLTHAGRAKLQGLGLGGGAPALLNTQAALRKHLASVTDANTVAFIDEAIKCLEAGLYRAAVVLTWVGAVATFYSHVVVHRLADFNSEARRRDPRWRDAKTADDLALMKESEFLHVLEAISVFGKSVKLELEGCLRLRNGCGHPNSLVVKEHRVASHIETLIDNVFARF